MAILVTGATGNVGPRERMRKSGSAEDVIEFVIGWYASPPKAAYTILPTVEEIIGRPARTIAQWAAEHAEIFRP